MIYVHVPFCRSFCTYCGFYSEVAPKCRKAEDASRQDELLEKYAVALESEVRSRAEDISRVFTSSGVSTLYIGGGTPSVLPPAVFERLVDSLLSVGHPCDFQEFTVEVNPEDIVEKGPEYVSRLLDLGVNRISMGVQSFDDGILKWMNRRHSAAQAVEAYRILEEAGAENISIDLIFGLPQMSEELWRETLHKALDISARGVPPKHISAYQLSVEEGSMLEKLIARGKWTEASEQLCERQYYVLCETLEAAGYHHYEISNYAQPGYEAVHNSAYWRDVPYVGLGPGAHSYMLPSLPLSSGTAAAAMSCRHLADADGTASGDDSFGKRQWNEADLGAYIEAGSIGDFSAVQGSEVLDEEQRVLERIMLGLRTAAGVPEMFLRRHCDADALDCALAAGNLIILENGSLRIPEDRFFISDSIVSDLV